MYDDVLAELVKRVKTLERHVARLERREQPLQAVGTFTPTFIGTTIAGTFTYVAQRGVYRRIGDVVLYSAQCAINAIGTTPTGTIRMSGLPFECANINGTNYPGAIGINSNVDYGTSWLELTAVVTPGTSQIYLYRVVDNTAAAEFPASQFTNASANLIVGGWYVTA
jgi:hypothetical protein